MQKLRIKRQSSCIRSSTVNLGHPVIKTPLIRSIRKSKTQNWGNSKLLGRIVLRCSMYPSHIFTIFQIFQNLWSRAIGGSPLNSSNLSLCPFIWNSHLFYLQISSFLWWQYLKQIFSKKYKTFLHLLKSVNNKHTLFELMSRWNIHQRPPW